MHSRRQIRYGGEEEITLKGTEYSIEDYLTWALVNTSAEYLWIARALADYGYYGQKYLSATQNWTIGTDYAEQTLKYHDSFNHDAVYAELASYEVEFNIEGLKARPVFGSLTQLEIRFKKAEGEEVYLDGNLVEPRMIGEGDYAVMTGGIKASQLTQSYTIQVGDKTDDVPVMWYARIMLGRDNLVLKDFMCAFYNYGAACGAFNN